MQPFAFLSELDPWAVTGLSLAALALLAFAARAAARWLLRQVSRRWRDAPQTRWSAALLHEPVLQRLAQMAPSLVVQAGIGAVPHLDAATATVVRNVALALTVLHG
ncbi:MAG: mechanosensitive ion channel family protein, partial [Comamonadaceae bacterium]|nr:mechanosensitive ion channel family protein [Comamonadaceae bacterium]